MRGLEVRIDNPGHRPPQAREARMATFVRVDHEGRHAPAAQAAGEDVEGFVGEDDEDLWLVGGGEGGRPGEGEVGGGKGEEGKGGERRRGRHTFGPTNMSRRTGVCQITPVMGMKRQAATTVYVSTVSGAGEGWRRTEGVRRHVRGSWREEGGGLEVDLHCGYTRGW